jgi:hypothetical protein
LDVSSSLHLIILGEKTEPAARKVLRYKYVGSSMMNFDLKLKCFTKLRFFDIQMYSLLNYLFMPSNFIMALVENYKSYIRTL